MCPLFQGSIPYPFSLSPIDKTVYKFIIDSATCYRQVHAEYKVSLQGRAEDRADGLVEHRLEALLRQSGALEVLDGAHVLGHRDALEFDTWKVI